MSAATLLSSLRDRGVILSAVGSKLTFDAPVGQLTDADRATLRAHKAELLALLASSGATQEAVPATIKQERAVVVPGTIVAPVTAPSHHTPKEHFSHEQIPTRPCPGCGGRAWRLRETPGSAGYWLWVCAGCADAVQAATANGPPKKT